MVEQTGPSQKAVPPEKDAQNAGEREKGAEKATPPDKQAAPLNKQATPADKQATPADKQAAPADKQAAPPDKEAAPLDKQAAPPDKGDEIVEALEKRIGQMEKRHERMEALEKRVAELEGPRNRAKWVAFCAIGGLGCAVAAFIYAASIPPPPPLPKTLDLEGLVVRDPVRRFRLEVGPSEAGWGLFLLDEQSAGAAAEEGQHARGIPRIELRLNEKGENRFIIRASGKQQSAVQMGVNSLGWPCVALFDKETGARRADFGETEVPAEGKLEKRSPASVVLRDNQGNLIWKAGEAATDFAPVTPPPVPSE